MPAGCPDAVSPKFPWRVTLRPAPPSRPGAQTPDQFAELRRFFARRKRGAETVEDVALDEVDHFLGGVLDVGAELFDHIEHFVQRDAGLHQFGAGLNHPRAGRHKAHAVWLEHAQLMGLDQPARIKLTAEESRQLHKAVLLGGFVGPGAGHRCLQAQQGADVLPRLPGREQFADARQGEAARQHLVDDAQSRQVFGAVNAGAAAALGGGIKPRS